MKFRLWLIRKLLPRGYSVRADPRTAYFYTTGPMSWGAASTVLDEITISTSGAWEGE